MKRFFPHPRMTLLLAILWLLLVNTLNLGHILLGLFLGWAIVHLCGTFLLTVPKVRKPLGLLLFIGKVFYDIVVANLQVVKLVLGPKAKLQPGFVEIPLELTDDLAISILASVITLTPGTCSADLSADRRILLVHGIDVPDPQALVADIKARYEAPLKEVFPCSAS